ncbi:NACHT domain-containing protein [Nonomuraea sp. NPDC050394]|uniref:NACHT domain-containing protein n=1 Tax=Nonomuraea sp. NPDC050394 TaxID=3364363 RepID=UPI003789BCFA
MQNQAQDPKVPWLPRVAWLTATLAPVVASVNDVVRSFAVKHPVLAVCAALLYWLGLLVLKFILPIAGRLAERWQERATSRLDRAYVRTVSGFGRNYRAHLLSALRYIDQKGLPTVGFYTPELDDVFIDVSLTYRPAHQIPGDTLSDAYVEAIERHSIAELINQKAPALLAIIGAPGSGKTTLLRHIARDICKHPRRIPRKIPILLYLRDHIESITSLPEKELSVLAIESLGRFGKDEPEGWFRGKQEEGKCVILLDGLDEVASDESRRLISSWLERQVSQFPRNDFIVTSRPHGYRTAPINGATLLQARRFDDTQVVRFITGWYIAIERISTGADNPAVQMRAQEGAEDLLKRLRSMPALYELTANPLLLTMIANVHRFRGALPASRHDLYRDICEVILWRRQEAKNIALQFPGDSVEGALRALAYEMMVGRVRDLPATRISAVLRPLLARFSGLVHIADFVEKITSCGILIEREKDLYSFAHQTFQEYLAAVYIHDKGIAHVLIETVNDTWWRETTLLYAARNDADSIVRACLQAGTAPALTLAFDCSEQTAELDPALRGELDALLDRVFRGEASPEIRHLVARVFVARRLQGTVQLESGSHICVQPISRAMYQIFTTEVADTRSTRQPDYPASGADMNSPVLGIRAEDALLFVAWINRLSMERTYRLPTVDEVLNVSAREIVGLLPHRVWLEPGENSPMLFVNGRALEVNITTGRVLLDRLQADISESMEWHFLAFLARTAATVGAVDKNLRTVVVHHFRRYANLKYAFDRVLKFANLLTLESSKVIAPYERTLGVMLRDGSGGGHLGSKLPFIGKTFNSDPYEAIKLNHDRVADLVKGLTSSAPPFAGENSRPAAGEGSHVAVLGSDDEFGMNYSLSQIVGGAYSEIMKRAWERARRSKIRDRVGIYLNCIQEEIVKQVRFEGDLRFPLPEEMVRMLHLISDTRLGWDEAGRWVRETLDHFIPKVESILLRHVQLDGRLAREIRLTATLLFLESKFVKVPSEMSHVFLQVAGAITQLEDRLCSGEPPDEAIVLSLD